MNPHRSKILDQLRNSIEPSIRYSIAKYIDDIDPNKKIMKDLQAEIKTSDRVKSLLEGLELKHPYSKWQGAHWILSLLPELNYPSGDEQLKPLRDQAYDWLFSKVHLKSIKTINGKVRRCASQEGNAIYYSEVLGLADERTDELVNRLLAFQWDDGGWNCDKNPKACNSSYNESLIPFRALIRYLHDNRDHISKSRINEIEHAITDAKEVFLKRELYISSTTGQEIKAQFTLLHFPYYWRYNVLFALKVMNEGGFLSDPRCQKAIALIESKELPTGGFPAEKRYYYSKTAQSGATAVNWGGVNKIKPNEWVSSEVYQILKASRRL
jgi:hypothetical protein